MIPEAFTLIIDIAERRNVRDIGKLPGCWEFTAGAWTIAVNGGATDRVSSAGDKVPGYYALATDGDGGIALISPRDGTCTPGAEESLVAALREELTK